MRREHVDAIGRVFFPMLVSLLRPVSQVECGGARESGCLSGLPLQWGDLVLRNNGRMASLEVTQNFANPHDECIGLTSIVPLPAGAVVESLRLIEPKASSQAVIGERRHARQSFDSARHSRCTAALVSEDAPGVFTVELSSLGSGHSAGVALRCAYPLDLSRIAPFQLSVRFDAGLATGSRTTRGVVRLGRGRALDAFVGLDRERAVLCDDDRPVLSDVVPGESLGVFAACDTQDGARAVFRGTIANRMVRLLIELTSMHSISAAPVRKPPPQHEPQPRHIHELMREYRRAAESESRRSQIAARFIEYGIRRHIVTRWTSLVAVSNHARGVQGQMGCLAAQA